MSILARLSFWVSPERMGDFETTYKNKLVPILQKHDLEESSERGRKTVEGVFSRLFEMETPSEVAVKARALRSDPAWKKRLQDLGAIFRTLESDGLLRTRFGVYQTPVGPGKTVEVGPGLHQGAWHSFSVGVGLPSPTVEEILQGREGVLWLGTWGGLSRYDGEQFTIFTTEDGLTDNLVRCILEDREGVLWLGTDDGVSRYDGRTFRTFTTEDGLAGNCIMGSMLEEREGDLWIGEYREGGRR